MKRVLAALVVTVAFAVGAVAANAGSTATISFSLDTATCKLTITSSKDISNFTVNGVKTDGVTTSTVVLNVANGDVITVKSGTSTASYTVSGCGDGHDHDGDHDPDPPHGGDDHDGDGDHDGNDHHGGLPPHH